jgi:hypothetical protein
MNESVSKYVKPKSMTWWASAFPLFAGVVLAVTSAIPGLEVIAGIIGGFFPGMSAVALINMGLIGIGLRGAVK